MLGRLKQAFSRATTEPLAKAGAVALWAAEQGFSYASVADRPGFSIAGQMDKKPWRLECGEATRDYMQGDELRARAELALKDDAAVLIMNRPLKDALEKRAYEIYTDNLQTTADPELPEEMRWLATYPEADWESLTTEFWTRYAVMADTCEHAQAWLNPQLAELLTSWPAPAPSEQTPFILRLMRGKAYLRMQYSPTDTATLAHATRIFTTACERGLAVFEADEIGRTDEIGETDETGGTVTTSATGATG